MRDDIDAALWQATWVSAVAIVCFFVGLGLFVLLGR